MRCLPSARTAAPYSFCDVREAVISPKVIAKIISEKNPVKFCRCIQRSRQINCQTRDFASLSATEWGEGRGEVTLGEQGHEVSASYPEIIFGNRYTTSLRSQ